MRPQAALIWKVIAPESPKDRKEAMALCLSRGINSGLFSGIEKQIFAKLVSHYEDGTVAYGTVPHAATVKSWYPSYVEDIDHNTLEDACLRVQEEFIRKKIEALLTTTRPTLMTDPLKAVLELRNGLESLISTQTNKGIAEFTEASVEMLMEELKTMKDKQGVVGLPFPWDAFSQGTGGMSKGDLILFWAIPKSMKTWIALYIIVCLARKNYRVLVFSKEMTWEKVRRRTACILTETHYGALTSGALSNDELESMREHLLLFAKTWGGNFRYTQVLDMSGKRGGTRELRRQIEEYKPDIVLVDSAYQLLTEAEAAQDMHIRLNGISTRLKEIAFELQIPVVGIFQENERESEKFKKTRGTASIAGSTAIVQDADLGIKVVLRPDLQQMSLRVAAGRDTAFLGGTIGAIPAIDFTWKGSHIFTSPDPEDSPKPQPSTEAVTSKLAAFGSAAVQGTSEF